MGMLLTEQSEYYRETGRATSVAWILGNLKKAGDFLLTYSPIMWILFFSLLALLINLIEG